MKFKTGLGVIAAIDGFTGFLLVLPLRMIVSSAVLATKLIRHNGAHTFSLG